MLSIKNLYKSFGQPGGEVCVLDGLSFTMQAASSVALLGESGSGKSTLLHLIAGLDKSQSGDIEFSGKQLSTLNESALANMRRHQISLVFQQFHLISTLSVLDNIRFQAALCQRFDNAFETQLIDRLGLSSLLKKLPHQLSRGQQQRVAIARALLHKPKLVLADEPTGNLDEQSSLEVMAVFTDLVKSAGSSLLMVTHSKEMATFMQRSVLLHNGRLSDI
jgi:putative ABC transport system ATP-binding protein|tara:strand:- start:540 stop:1199 length:660 start_codon:yes stop_codon:yes gene_type:complete